MIHRLLDQFCPLSAEEATDQEDCDGDLRWNTVQAGNLGNCRSSTISAALSVCLRIAQEQDALTVRNLSRQLRRWLREEGKGERGWLEVRMVNGHGPSVSYRYRNPGEREIRTEYSGRGDRLLPPLSAGPTVRRARRQDEE